MQRHRKVSASNKPNSILNTSTHENNGPVCFWIAPLLRTEQTIFFTRLIEVLHCLRKTGLKCSSVKCDLMMETQAKCLVQIITAICFLTDSDVVNKQLDRVSP